MRETNLMVGTPWEVLPLEPATSLLLGLLPLAFDR